MSDGREEVRTSNPQWLAALARTYKTRAAVHFVDDAGIGVNPAVETILEMGRTAGLSRQQWVAVCIALGMSVVGVGLVAAAVMDPEPTTKLMLLALAGAALIGSGGFAAIRILTGHKPPRVKVGKDGIDIDWN